MTDILARAVKLKPKALRHFKIDLVFKDKQAKAAGSNLNHRLKIKN